MRNWGYEDPGVIRSATVKKVVCSEAMCVVDHSQKPAVLEGLYVLTAIIDLYSRKIVGWGLSNTLTAEWCKLVLQAAIAMHGKPGIVNSDQGTQYTSALWTQYLEAEGIQISMDGKGRATDNIWIERFWKSAKHDYVYLNPAEDGFELYQGIEGYMAYYNEKMHHTTRQSPNKRYHEPLQKAA